jgi:hypothetical protein
MPLPTAFWKDPPAASMRPHVATNAGTVAGSGSINT